MNVIRKEMIEHELNRMVETIIDKYKPQKIILYGSVATGHISEWSDIDLIIIKETNRSFYERLEEIAQIAQPDVGTDIIVYTPEEELELKKEDPFYKEEVLKKGKVIYNAGEQMDGIRDR